MGRQTTIRRAVRIIGPAVVALTAIVATSGAAGATVPRGDPHRPSQAAPRDTGPPAGPLVADSGFRPQSDGFSFGNYDCNANTTNHSCVPPETNLTAAEMRELFGDTVCASTPSDTCRLTAAAQTFMNKQNVALPKGGHCFGFSVASLQLWKRLITPEQFGATTTPGIQLRNNQAIQREIAYAFVTQNFTRVHAAQLVGTPNQILNSLISLLTSNASDTYTIGFHNGKTGDGHAVTPYAVEDLGSGRYAVLIYDNNYPGDSTRAMIFDRTTNTWAYQLEPSLIWRGSAADPEISLVPTSATLGPATAATRKTGS